MMLYEMTPEAVQATDAVMKTYKALPPMEQAAVDALAEDLAFNIKQHGRDNPGLILKPAFSINMAIELIGKLGIFILKNERN